MRYLSALAQLIVIFIPAWSAFASCISYSHPISEYLAQQKNWSIVTIDDLPADDRRLWEKYHAGDCPGLAKANFYGRGLTSFGVALFRKNLSGLEEKLVLIRDSVSNITVTTLVKAQSMTTPFVVWTAPPGVVQSDITHSNESAEFDTIVYEKMEATSTVFFLKDNRLRSVVATD